MEAPTATFGRWRRTAAKPLLSLLSRLGSETRQPLAPVTSPPMKRD